MGTRLLTKNMGVADRSFRAFVLAPAAIAGALILGASSIGGILLLVVAAVAAGTSATGICPGYVPFGIDTRSRTPLPH